MSLAEWSWVAIFMAALLVWFPQLRYGSYGLLAVGYMLALIHGQMIDRLAMIPIVLLLLAAYLVYMQKGSCYRVAGHLLFILLALALNAHMFPGFYNLCVISERFTPDAVRYQCFLNLDQPLTGFWVLWFSPFVQLGHASSVWLKRAIITGSITTVLCLSGALWFKIVIWEPKWPIVGWLWVVDNLLLASATEEALFRGYLQEGLGRWFAQQRYGDWLAIALTAGLFGLVHYPGGWLFTLLASVAGVGYGIAYRHAGWQAATLTHFGLNCVHFFLFTYPMLLR